MALVLSEDEKLLAEAARGFLAQKSPVAALRSLRDSESPAGFDPALWADMAEQGFAGVLIDADHGGSSFGHVGAGLIFEQMGHTLAASPMLASAILGATLLTRAGNPEQQNTYLPLIAKGEMILAFACEEAVRHDPRHITTSATPNTGDGYVLNGEKRFVLDGHVADRLIVVARTSGEGRSPEGISLFLVDTKAAGVIISRTLMVDSRNAAMIRFENVPVAAADILGTLDTGYAVLEAALDVARAMLAAEMLGVASEAFARTLDYLKTREQFGQKIGAFQALQHRAAHLFCEIELGRSVVLKALQALDNQDAKASRLCSLAKAKLGQVAKLVTNEAVQMHGGIGMTDDCDIGLFMKRARAAGETFGDSYYHLDRIASLGGY